MLNRATGRCVCQEDERAGGVPAAAATAPAGTASAVQVAGAVATPGWAPPGAVDAAEPPPPPPPPAGWAEADVVPGAPTSTGPAGHYHGVVPRLRTAFKVYDLHVYPDRIALDPVKGADPEQLGMAIGFVALCGLLGAVLGQAVGRQIAKSATVTRLGRTAWAPPEALAAEGAEVIPKAAITGVVARHHGAGGRLRLEVGGGTRKLSWAKPHVKGIDVDRLFRDVAPGRSEIFPVSPARVALRYVGYAFLVLVLVAMVVAIAVGVLGEEQDTTTGGPSSFAPAVASGAVAPLRRACETWGAFGASSQPTIEEVRGVIATVRPDLEAAAGADASLQPAADSIAFLDSYFALPSEELQPQVEGAAAKVDEACSRAG